MLLFHSLGISYILATRDAPGCQTALFILDFLVTVVKRMLPKSLYLRCVKDFDSCLLEEQGEPKQGPKHNRVVASIQQYSVFTFAPF